MSKKLHLNESGVAHLLVIVLVVLVVAAVGYGGWRVASHKTNSSNSTKSSTSSSGSSTVSSTGIDATCLAQYHDSNLCHFESLASATPIDKTPYVATLTSTMNNANETMTYQQDGKGNNSLNISGGTPDTQVNSVQIDGAFYLYNGSAWIKYPSAASASSQTQDPSSNLSFLGSVASVKFTKVGTEACGSLTCLKYQISDNATPGVVQYVWFDTSQYKLREFSATDPSNGTLDMKLSYQDVSIKMPSPVQDFSTLGQ